LINRNCSGFGTDASGCALVRNGAAVTNGQFGTLTIRRRFTNRTGQSVTRLRFRAVNISTLNSPGFTDTSQADIRMLDAPNTVVTDEDGEPVPVQGTTVERTPGQTANNNGGGHNSTVVVSLVGSVAPNASVDVQFRLGVQRNGRFRYLLNVEALIGATQSVSPARKVAPTRKSDAKGQVVRPAVRRR
jgi:hypothetical protein